MSRRAPGRAHARLTGVPSKAFSPRMPSDTSSVMVLPIRFGAGVEQRLHRPGVPVGIGRPVRPVMVAAAGRQAGDVEQILGGKGETAQRPPCRARDAHARAWNEGADIDRHDR